MPISRKHETTKGVMPENQKARLRVIVLACQKGGAGKTTLAAHIAVAAEAAGAGPAVLIDTDPQGSLSAWWNERKANSPALAPASVAELTKKLSDLAQAGYAWAVVDTPPAITEAISAVVQAADLVLIPTGLSQDWGSGGDCHWRVRVVGWLELLSEAGTERAIVDGAPNLQQQVGAAPRPAHLL